MTTTDPKALRDRLKAIISAIDGKAPASSGTLSAHIDGADVSIRLHGARYYVYVRGPGYNDTGLDYSKDFDRGRELHPGMSLNEIDKQRDVPFKLTVTGNVMALIDELERDPVRYVNASRDQDIRKRQAWKKEQEARMELARQERMQQQLRLASENSQTIKEIIAHVERIRRLSTVSAQLADRTGGPFRMPSATQPMFIPHDHGTILCEGHEITDAKTVRPFFYVQCKGVYCTVTTDGLKATGTAKDLENLRDRLAAVSDPFAAAKRVGKCFFCFRDLTDEVSRHYGYGPDCASANYDLPYDREVLSK